MTTSGHVTPEKPGGSTLWSRTSSGHHLPETSNSTSGSLNHIGFISGNITLSLHKTLPFLKASYHSSLTLTERSLVESAEVCIICFDEMQNEDGDVHTIIGCNHRFHEKCIKRWKEQNASCPVCRGVMSEELMDTEEKQELSSLENSLFFVRLALRENLNDLSSREKMANTLLAPIGLAWVVLIFLLLLLFETMLVCFCVPLVHVKLVIDVFNDRPTSCFDLCLVLGMCIYLIFAAIVSSLPAFFLLSYQIPLLLYISSIFCFRVFSCKMRWLDAFAYISRRLALYSFYW